MVCPHGQGEEGGEGVEPVQTFCRQGGRVSFFRDFVRTSFIGWIRRLVTTSKNLGNESRKQNETTLWL